MKNPGILASLAAFIIVVGGMKIAAPLLLSLFIAILRASPYTRLQDKGVPRWRFPHASRSTRNA